MPIDNYYQADSEGIDAGRICGDGGPDEYRRGHDPSLPAHSKQMSQTDWSFTQPGLPARKSNYTMTDT